MSRETETLNITNNQLEQIAVHQARTNELLEQMVISQRKMAKALEDISQLIRIKG